MSRLVFFAPAPIRRGNLSRCGLAPVLPTIKRKKIIISACSVLRENVGAPVLPAQLSSRFSSGSSRFGREREKKTVINYKIPFFFRGNLVDL